MQVSISGATGFTGNILVKQFEEKGWQVIPIGRESFMMNEKDFIEKKIGGSDVVVNLAGAPIQKRWSAAYKKEIRDSRIMTTAKIAAAIRKSERRPSLFISVSAIGIYDSAGVHTEESMAFADDFLGKVCRDWEHEALEAADSTRVAIMRTGLVLSRNGGALKTMTTPFRIGLGGTIGSGKQAFSWIHETDLVNAYMFVIDNNSLSGIINAVAPDPTTNLHFTKTFGKVLNQPAVMRVPVLTLKLIYGEGAEPLTSGQHVIPEKLLNAGFEFRFPTIEKALLNLFS